MPVGIDELRDSLHRGGEPWLLLYDIDGTLVDTGGKGMLALQRAIVDVFGSGGPALDLAGSTDLGIIDGLFAHFQIEPSHALTQDFFHCYHLHLEKSLAAEPLRGRVLDGAADVLGKFHNLEHIAQGLLTGNTSSGAEIKLRHYGLSDWLSFGAFGSDHADRNMLGPVAVRRAAEVTGRTFTPSRILVIGDTPKDIACAHACGARCIAVSTGQFSENQLRAKGADWVLGSLRELL